MEKPYEKYCIQCRKFTPHKVTGKIGDPRPIYWDCMVCGIHNYTTAKVDL